MSGHSCALTVLFVWPSCSKFCSPALLFSRLFCYLLLIFGFGYNKSFDWCWTAIEGIYVSLDQREVGGSRTGRSSCQPNVLVDWGREKPQIKEGEHPNTTRKKALSLESNPETLLRWIGATVAVGERFPGPEPRCRWFISIFQPGLGLRGKIVETHFHLFLAIHQQFITGWTFKEMVLRVFRLKLTDEGSWQTATVFSQLKKVPCVCQTWINILRNTKVWCFRLLVPGYYGNTEHPSREIRSWINMNIYEPNASSLRYEKLQKCVLMCDILSAHWLTRHKPPAVSRDCLPAASNSSPLNSVKKFYLPDRYLLIFQEQTWLD